MGDLFKVVEYNDGKIKGYVLVDTDNMQKLLMPNNDVVIFQTKEIAEKVSRLMTEDLIY